MNLNEYIEWYKEHFGGLLPSQKLIDKFLSIHQPEKSQSENGSCSG